MKLDLPVLTHLAPSIQRSILFTVGGLVACGVIVFLGVRPQQHRVVTLSQESDALNAALNQMRADVASTESLKASLAATNSVRDALLASGVLEPLLGSFAMRGKALLDPVAQETGFHLESVRELPPIPLILPVPPPEQTYARQPIEFTGQGSYTQIVAFITRAEASQPLATLSGLHIRGQQPTPELHKAIVTFEWPIKGEKLKPAAPPKK